MDEPFGALDPVTRREIHREFRRIQASVRKTIVHRDARHGGGVRARRRVSACWPTASWQSSATQPRSRGRPMRASGRCSRRCSRRQRCCEPRAVRLVEFWRAHAGGVRRPAGSARAARRRSRRWSRSSIGVPIGILAARRPRAGCAHRLARQRRADDSQPRDVRLPPAAAVRRRTRRARRRSSC